ncbi:MAG: DNA alkylation repair protein [Candidatus Shapirobacteria bacterium]|jgi:3-methyladenine DNA glycosylase AlkD
MRTSNLSALISDLKSLSSPAKIAVFKRFFKTGPGQYGEGDRFLGLTVPQIRSVVRKYWPTLALVDLDHLLQSPYHEHRTVALASLNLLYRQADLKTKKELYLFYLHHTSRINNWDLVDISAPNIVGAYLLEQQDRSILYKLAQSKDIWQKRISIISTLTFIKNDQFADTLAIAKILMGDKHDLIHKATGWMLREVGKRDLPVLLNFLDEFAPRLPRTCLRYAIEKFPDSCRLHYLHLPISSGTSPNSDRG